MKNFLKETIEKLIDCGLQESDVLWVGNGINKTSWDEFKKLADFEYDDGFGSNYIDTSFMVVGKDWWLERSEYDGSEWWVYQSYPEMPSGDLTINDIIDGYYR